MSAHLTARTVHDDLVADVSTGGAGLDWFWANLAQDTITDQSAGEVLN
jgi:hypothetical protein